MILYYKTRAGLVVKKIVNSDDSSFHVSIPFAPDNTDYREYLKWLAEGNEVLPADE